MTSSTTAMPRFLRRALIALWLSLALHAALIGMVRIEPRTVVAIDQVLEARLENPSPAQPDQEAAEMPLLDASTDLQTLITVHDEQPIVFQPFPENKAEARPEPQPEPSPQPLAARPVSEPARPNNPEPAKIQPGPSIDIPLAVDTQYYTAKELDVQPRPVRKIEPAYPPEYESQGASGYAILEMRVENDGEISDLKVVEISPSGHDAFGREALEAFRQVRFIPAKRKGRQVRALFRVKVVFESADNAN